MWQGWRCEDFDVHNLYLFLSTNLHKMVSSRNHIIYPTIYLSTLYVFDVYKIFPMPISYFTLFRLCSLLCLFHRYSKIPNVRLSIKLTMYRVRYRRNLILLSAILNYFLIYMSWIFKKNSADTVTCTASFVIGYDF